MMSRKTPATAQGGTHLQPAKFLAMVTKRRPAGRPDCRVQAAADDAVLRFTPFQRLLPEANLMGSANPEQIAVFNSPVLQQYPKNGCGLNLVAAAASCARARENMQIFIQTAAGRI